MTVLITGATGFIGRHLAASLTATGHRVLAVMRRPERLDALRLEIDRLRGDPNMMDAIAGDLDAPDLGLSGKLPPLTAVVHLGARFAWSLPPEIARRTNADGALAVAELARRQRARLVFVSGFMLEDHAHLRGLGIDMDRPEATDWERVYAKTGAYEASKLEGAVRTRAYARRHGLDFVEIQPATVSGHSQTGELDTGQPLFTLIDNLAHGRLSMIPGTPAHWLPLVSVDALATLMTAAIDARRPPERLLALDPETPNLAGLLSVVATELGRRPPRRHLSIGVLRALLRVPGLARVMNTAPESLQFLRTTRFDTGVTAAFRREHGIRWPDIERSIRASARYYRSLDTRVAP